MGGDPITTYVRPGNPSSKIGNSDKKKHPPSQLLTCPWRGLSHSNSSVFLFWTLEVTTCNNMSQHREKLKKKKSIWNCAAICCNAVSTRRFHSLLYRCWFLYLYGSPNKCLLYTSLEVIYSPETKTIRSVELARTRRRTRRWTRCVGWLISLRDGTWHVCQMYTPPGRLKVESQHGSLKTDFLFFLGAIFGFHDPCLD